MDHFFLRVQVYPLCSSSFPFAPSPSLSMPQSGSLKSVDGVWERQKWTPRRNSGRKHILCIEPKRLLLNAKGMC